MRVALALVVATAFVAVPGAVAKTLTKIVAVGSGGAYVELRGLDWSSLQTSAADVAPSGGFILLYPLMERGVPAQPARFFPASGIACFSWDRTVLGTCGHIADDIAAQVAALPTLPGEPTVLKSLVVGRTSARLQSNGAVAIELAFNRPQLSRSAPRRPANCVTLRATWLGAEASARPTRFWSCKGGLWSRGRIYPVAPLSSI
jgi:hypothetical protein